MGSWSPLPPLPILGSVQGASGPVLAAQPRRAVSRVTALVDPFLFPWPDWWVGFFLSC